MGSRVSGSKDWGHRSAIALKPIRSIRTIEPSMSSSRGDTPIRTPSREMSPGKPDDDDDDVDVNERAYLNAGSHGHSDVVDGGDMGKGVDQSSKSSFYLFILALSIGG